MTHTMQQVTMLDIANNIDKKLTFIDFNIDGELFPQQPQSNSLFSKVLASNPFPIGLLELKNDEIKISDETKHVFATFSIDQMTFLEIGIYRSAVRTAPLALLSSRYTLYVHLVANEKPFFMLNDDIQALGKLVSSLNLKKIHLVDEMNLMKHLAQLDELDNQLFEELAQDTKFFMPLQIVGSNVRV